MAPRCGPGTKLTLRADAFIAAILRYILELEANIMDRNRNEYPGQSIEGLKLGPGLDATLCRRLKATVVQTHTLFPSGNENLSRIISTHTYLTSGDNWRLAEILFDFVYQSQKAWIGVSPVEAKKLHIATIGRVVIGGQPFAVQFNGGAADLSKY
jgi:hypothetical protein